MRDSPCARSAPGQSVESSIIAALDTCPVPRGTSRAAQHVAASRRRLVGAGHQDLRAAAIDGCRRAGAGVLGVELGRRGRRGTRSATRRDRLGKQLRLRQHAGAARTAFPGRATSARARIASPKPIVQSARCGPRVVWPRARSRPAPRHEGLGQRRGRRPSRAWIAAARLAELRQEFVQQLARPARPQRCEVALAHRRQWLARRAPARDPRPPAPRWPASCAAGRCAASARADIGARCARKSCSTWNTPQSRKRRRSSAAPAISSWEPGSKHTTAAMSQQFGGRHGRPVQARLDAVAAAAKRRRVRCRAPTQRSISTVHRIAAGCRAGSRERRSTRAKRAAVGRAGTPPRARWSCRRRWRRRTG